ncbi:MAG: GTPase ObgE [bacterium]|nr:GTPase ObgE [bacterium]
MVFIDEVEIYIKAGNGGDGAVSFRREKYIPNGGPDGGDGAKGGDIVFEVLDHIHGLSSFNRAKRFLAENGQNGMGKNMHGKNAEDLILKVPVGTQIFQKDELLADMTPENNHIVFLNGGKGGWGNQHFATSIKQAPKWAKKGMRGESAKIKLVLKMIADVGLIGLPNAGKSTLISTLTNARPKIANYPFTTLEPNLGTFISDDKRFIIADIPGLIEGAHEGRGLGIKFLKHVERTKLLVHLVDSNSPDPIADYNIVRIELGDFSKKLLKKKEIVILSKIDLISAERLAEISKQFKAKKITVIPVSTATNAGVKILTDKIKKNLGK